MLFIFLYGLRKRFLVSSKIFLKEILLDCILSSNDFFVHHRLETYQFHTKCVTEEQKYNATGWKPPTSHNKGERKQQEWVDIVQSIVSTATNLDFASKQLLKTISRHNNVPRKRPKFMVRHLHRS